MSCCHPPRKGRVFYSVVYRGKRGILFYLFTWKRKQLWRTNRGMERCKTPAILVGARPSPTTTILRKRIRQAKIHNEFWPMRTYPTCTYASWFNIHANDQTVTLWTAKGSPWAAGLDRGDATTGFCAFWRAEGSDWGDWNTSVINILRNNRPRHHLRPLKANDSSTLQNPDTRFLKPPVKDHARPGTHITAVLSNLQAAVESMLRWTVCGSWKSIGWIQSSSKLRRWNWQILRTGEVWYWAPAQTNVRYNKPWTCHRVQN